MAAKRQFGAKRQADSSYFMSGKAQTADFRITRAETADDRGPSLQHLIKVNKIAQSQIQILQVERRTFENECISLKASLACMEGEKRSRDLLSRYHEEELLGLRDIFEKSLIDSPVLDADKILSQLNRENTSRKVLISEFSAKNSQQGEVIIDLRSRIERLNEAIDIQKSIIEGQVKTIDEQKSTIVEQRKTQGAYSGRPTGQPRATATTSIDAANPPDKPAGTRPLEQVASSRKRKPSITSPEKGLSDEQYTAAEPLKRPRRNAVSHASGASLSQSEIAKMTDVKDGGA